MNFMIRTASVVALFTFWLAAIVWTVLIVAAPANAAPSDEHGVGSTSTSAPADHAHQPVHSGRDDLPHRDHSHDFSPQKVDTNPNPKKAPTVKSGSTPG